MSDAVKRIDHEQLGPNEPVEVLRYADNDVTIHDALQVADGYSNEQGSVVLSWNQLRKFTKVVEDNSDLGEESEVRNVDVGHKYSLGRNQSGNFASLERNEHEQFKFAIPDDNEVVLLTPEQTQAVFEYLVETGYDDMWGIHS